MSVSRMTKIATCEECFQTIEQVIIDGMVGWYHPVETDEMYPPDWKHHLAVPEEGSIR